MPMSERQVLAMENERPPRTLEGQHSADNFEDERYYVKILLFRNKKT